MSTISATLVPTGTWTVDPSHSSINFSVRHLGIAKVRGSFAEFSGSLTSDGSTFSGTGAIAAASVDTGDAQRDEHLRSADFFNAETHPTIVFAVAGAGAATGSVRGELTINGVTRTVELEAEAGGSAEDPYGNQRIGLELHGEIRRADFDIRFDHGNAVVGDKVKLELDLSLIGS